MLLIITDNILGPAFDNFELLCNTVVLQAVLISSVRSALLLPLLLAGDVHPAQRSPLFLLASSGQDKSDFEEHSVSGKSGFQPTMLHSHKGMDPAQLQTCWCGCVVASRSSAAPRADSRVLSTAWAWHEVIATLPHLG